MSDKQHSGLSPEFDDADEGIDVGTGTRTACILLLDTSGSMSGKKISRLNDGLQRLEEDLKADDVARMSVEVAAVTFGGSVQQEMGFTLADKYRSPTLRAGGRTSMYGALLEGLEMVADRKAYYDRQGLEYNRPWVWLMTDGRPTDNGKKTSAIQEVKTVVNQKGATVFAVGIGDDADFGVLEEVSPERSPLKLKGMAFREMFIWLSNSLGSVSRSKPDQGQVPLEKPTGEHGWAEVKT